MGKKVVRWICVGLAVVVALAAVWLIWFSMTKRNEDGEVQQPPVVQTDPAAGQEQNEDLTGQDPVENEQTPEQMTDEPQTDVTEETSQNDQPVEDEPIEEESTEEDYPAVGPNDLGWG